MTKLKYFLFILIIGALHYPSVSYSGDIDAEINPADFQCLRNVQVFLGKNKFSSISTNRDIDDILALFFQEYPECNELQLSEAAMGHLLEHGFPEYIKEINKNNENPSVPSALSKSLESFGSYARKHYESLFKEPLVSGDLLNCFVEGKRENCKYSPVTGAILNTGSLATMGYVFYKYYNPDFYPSSGFMAFTAVSTLLSGAWWSNSNLKKLMLRVVAQRAYLLISRDHYYLMSSGKIQNMIFISFLANNIVSFIGQNAMRLSYLFRTNVDKFLAGLGVLAFYIYRIRTPEEQVLFMGNGVVSCAIATFAALGPSFFHALSGALGHGQNEALTYELSEKAHLVALYGGALFFSMISAQWFQGGDTIASLMVMTAYIARSFYNLGQPVIEPGEDFNPVLPFLLSTLSLLLMYQ
ncbi:hypothetical protein [Endozoicomonas euniceicola]|uniref:Uncharacterized protein n=1 Tax=Endozoicomonas euniceicola TaxID=1234143 RepID=A0ABY6H1B5_9GAMM|nr:hypothetical protein [Endozoicomonas euniceicola]UYM17944.1 hypothetical protein NX720_08575 [Endozoicomonas euniceicola]